MFQQKLVVELQAANASANAQARELRQEPDEPRCHQQADGRGERWGGQDQSEQRAKSHDWSEVRRAMITADPERPADAQ